MGGSPRFSVVVPTYNGTPYVEDAVRSTLEQDCEFDYEVLVVDDGSTDGTVETVRAIDDERLRVLENETNHGIAETMNRGAKEARAPLLAFNDHDDIWYETKLTAHSQAHRESDATVVYSDFINIDGEGEFIQLMDKTGYPETGEALFEELFLRGNFLPFSNVTMEREAWEAVGGLDPHLTIAADYDLWLRLSTEYTFEHLAENLLEERLHDDNVAKDYEATYRDDRYITEKMYKRFDLSERVEAKRRYFQEFRYARRAYLNGATRTAAVHAFGALRHRPELTAAGLGCLAVLDLVTGPLSLGNRCYELYRRYG